MYDGLGRFEQGGRWPISTRFLNVTAHAVRCRIRNPCVLLHFATGQLAQFR